MLRSLSAAMGLALLSGVPGWAAPVKVVSFSPVLTEIATRVGGDRVRVDGLVKLGTDPHEYQPTPGDLRQVAAAALILTSGRNLDHYQDKLAAAAGKSARVIAVGDELPALPAPESSGSDGHSHGDDDPHWWTSVANVQRATRIVRDALAAIAPADRATFDANAAAYLAELTALDKWIRRQVATLPRDQRVLVTSHDAFQYFARDHGFKVAAIEGVSSDKQASTQEIRALIDRIRAERVKAIFLEETVNPKVSAEITRETGARIGGTLYADGPGPGAETYEAMQRHNVTTIVEALR